MPDLDNQPPAPRPGGFRRAIVPISLALVAVAAMGALGWKAFEGQREDVAIARAFLTHIAAEQYGEAEDLMTAALIQRVGPGGLRRLFSPIEPWDHIGFSSRSTNGFGDTRSTELYGVGEAVSGCESELQINLRNSRIQAFDITPLCPRNGTDI
ncbi:hypothetical protein [Gymnodinialimonas sp. 57CJ19]|uniref:hypothetical protein n=1 Tax=Gymnodinialimonas sp. 57CJ19 TaxID=3138498 RepID=UPI003134258A